MSAAHILAYLDRWSVMPGESLSCRVSCEGAGTFDAELVRVVQGDTHPDGPGYREEVVSAELGGPFPARIQTIEPGSFAIVEDAEPFAALTSFATVAAISPTTPGKGAQTILARRDRESGHGFEMYIDADGAVAAEVVTAQGSARVSTTCALTRKRWYTVAASYDAETGELCVRQEPKVGYPQVGDRASRTVAGPRGLSQSGVGSALTIAARAGTGRCERRIFNGRIDNPKLYAGPLLADPRSAPGSDAKAVSGKPVAAWDFSLDIPSQRIRDVSGNELHGTLVNLPTRGVSGYAWDGTAHDWPNAPGHYSAIHFHDDDLYDVQWEEDFELRVPQDLASGVYAVRLYTDSAEFYTPFCVRSTSAGQDNAVVFLLPTASYMAYANNRIGLDVPETELVCGRLVELTESDLYMQTHPELGLSFYDLHGDGSGVYYSSRLRPIMDMQPKFVGKLGGAGSNVWQFNADTHILGWLERLRTGFDVITDEDLHREGVASIEGYRVVITGSHPEYYSAEMRTALQKFSEGDGRLMYLGGNGFYWRVSFHPELPGVIECRKSEDGIRAFAPDPGDPYSSFTGEYTGLWRRNGEPPNTLVGVGMVAQGFDISSPYVRAEASRDPRVAFAFQGIDEDVIGDYGLSGGAAAGLEVDAANVDLGTPAHALIVASSQIHTDLYLMTPEDMLDPVPGLGGTEAEIIRADLVFFETPGGGAVFSVGSIAWAGSMAWNGYDNTVSKLTENVLRRFIDPEPF
ncbi:MAG: N,N-dimethylformamidase beta subunit family domain-containing protein [Gammaproteobacteria bacterium]